MAEQSAVHEMCSYPPELNEPSLIAFIDGEEDQEVYRHLQICKYCSERANQLERLQQSLRQRLFRILCPSSKVLAEFHYGLLAEAKMREIQQHVQMCPFCKKEIANLMHMDKPAEDQDSPDSQISMHAIPGVRRIVAKLNMPNTLKTVYGTNRSLSSEQFYAYQAEQIELTLDIHRILGSKQNLVMYGNVYCLDDSLSDTYPGTVSLLTPQTVATSVPLDDGSFVIEDIRPGCYSLSLRLSAIEIFVDSLII